MQSNTLLLADMFESFCNKCLDICEVDPVQFLSGPGSVWKRQNIEVECVT